MFGIHLGRAGSPRRWRGEKIIAVADIGSGSAAVAIVALPADGPARILAAERRILPIEERAPEAIIAAIAQHLSEAGEHVLAAHRNKGGTMPRSVHMVIRAPWTRSKTVSARAVFPKTVRISRKIIGELSQQALASDTEFERGNLMEAGVVRVEVNGYPTGQPEGKPGDSLSVSALISECDVQLRASVQGVLQQLFGTQPAATSSGVRAILSVMRDMQGAPDDFVIVDMASEGTNFVVVRGGVTTEHAAMPEGKNSILRRIGGNNLPADTLAMLRLIALGECHDPACATLSAAMMKSEPALVPAFGDVIAKLVSRQRLPNQLILATHEGLMPWLSAFFSRIDFAQFTTTTQPFTVSTLKPVDLAHWALPDEMVRADTGVLLAAALVNIREQQ